MAASVFQCATIECDYAIASDGLNGIQLKALRMWPKTCPKCKMISHWHEQTQLNTETIQAKVYGGSNAKTTHETSNEVRRPKRRTNGEAGYH